MDNIIYLYLEDRYSGSIPPEAIKFCDWLRKNENNLEENKICVATRYEDMTYFLYITLPKNFIEQNFPEILRISKSKPFLPEHLDWIPKNYGLHMLEPKYLDTNIEDWI